jgi:hypothetical protein
MHNIIRMELLNHSLLQKMMAVDMIRRKKKFHVSGYIGQKIRVGRSAKNFFFQIFLLHRFWSK